MIAVLFLVTNNNCKPISAITFKCSYRMRSFISMGDLYTCDAKVLLDGNEKVTAVSGTHETGKGNVDVQGLSLSS